MVTSAVWTDFDGDGLQDLITVGEWMPIRVFRNFNGQLKEVTERVGLSKTVGWWNRIIETDYDNDGDVDFIIGNLGMNYKFKASPEKPFHIYSNDFDGNRVMDVVLAKYDGDNQVPVRGRECSSQQMPFIAQKFTSYHDFANADMSDIFGENGLSEALHYEANMFESIILENGNGSFSIKKLPIQAQVSTIQGIISEDFDKDGIKDLFIAGNMFGSEPETTRSDASIGLFLKGTIQGDYEPISSTISGISLPFDVKDLQLIRLGNNQQLGVLITSNNDQVRLMKVN